MPAEEVARYAPDRRSAKRLRDQHGFRVAYHHHLMTMTATVDEISAHFDRAVPK